MSEFIPGQRWISNTESNLGLGLVTSVSNRRVEMLFPAVAEERTYAVDNAPLSRVIYPVGEQVRNAAGVNVTITAQQALNGYMVYQVEDAQGDVLVLEERDLDSAVHFSKPHDRLFAGQVDKITQFKLRVETLKNQFNHLQSESYGLLGPRVQLLPHQLYIAQQVAQRFAPRVLLADEVGLGKTIEAGLILHQQLISGKASRALIVVPDSLVHQWLIEMLRRFNLRFTILDELRCEALELSDEGVNPFETAQLVLCNLSFLKSNPDRLVQALDAGWDMLVVDEAHHLVWSEEESSPEYICIEALAREVKGLLLLTATPEQLGVDSHFARLRLLDPDRYYSLEQFRSEEESYQPVSQLVAQLLAEGAREQLQDAPEVFAQLRHYLGDEMAQKLQDELHNDSLEQAIQDAVASLLDQHGTGRVLFRNTRDGVSGFPKRILHSYPLSEPDFYLESERQLMAQAGLEERLHPELILADRWLEADPRVQWLVDWLKDNRDEKALVICAYANTAKSLEAHLRLYEGVRSSVFHEGMSLVNRDRAAAYFADEEDSAQVLICSEIGSEGRNFQFASHLILFDLPLNPDLLEQRIGRLDRIGQRNDVQIHVPHYEFSAQSTLLDWFHRGLNCFERACPVGQVLFDQFLEQLIPALFDEYDEANIEALIGSTRIEADRLLEQLQQGRDQLLELNSCKPEKAQAIAESMEVTGNSIELSRYMERMFDQFGVEQQAHSSQSIILSPGEHMHYESLPGLPNDGMTATYSRSLALGREDIQFMTWEHPLVQGTMDIVVNGDFGNTAVCSIKLPPLKPGTLLLEAIYILHCAAPKSLQIQRYLPQTLSRIVVDTNGTDLSEILTEAHINNLAERVGRRQAVEIVKHTRPDIDKMVKRVEGIAETQLPAMLDQAKHNVETLLGAEQQRLTALATVNPNIRQEEIDYLAQNRAALEQHLQTASLKLDAIRVIVAT
ncbi:RNA polymerase-associated protein RapA [Amphritea sp. 1_MG-2023]|uniref:RNA polymerase-associated protein RapA n=1 Tax=Amphritea sp. 1_MG-2023 TaxID=3062670 RepID=UPI0026E486E2|nr:RNA polymerase-associated protein RapA [Amphritea sp. 1_MG-2023]MDO6561843.1 RNA polymerase-associated protein RapA [Amphritea sp. 1_MG-2023]